MFLVVCVTFSDPDKCFLPFASLLLSKGRVLNCLRHFNIAREVFCIVYVTFR